MRVDGYNENVTDDVRIIEDTPCGRGCIGVRLRLPSAAFSATRDDEDRSVVTLWLGDRADAVAYFANVLAKIRGHVPPHPVLLQVAGFLRVVADAGNGVIRKEAAELLDKLGELLVAPRG